MGTVRATSAFLRGNFAPVHDEIDSERLSVIGEIPAELTGMFVRNGPNPQFTPIGRYHWFDGDGMLHGIHLRDGCASYRNRYVQTRGLLKEQDAQRAIWTGLLEPPQIEIPEGATKNRANTSLIWHSGRLLTLWEAGEPYAITLPNLETRGPHTFDNKLKFPVTAHPKVDPETGEMLFFGYSFAPPYLQYGIVSPTGELLRTEPIDIPVGVMMHDFAITPRFTVFLDLPLTYRPERVTQGKRALAFERDRASRFGILPRHGDNTQVRWFEASACYVFHTLNAYEAGDEVVLVACRMSSYDLSGANSDPESGIPRLHEWRFNLSTGMIQERRLSPIPAEFPRINEQFMGRPVKYGFASKTAATRLPRFDGLIKLNFESEGLPTTQVHALGGRRYCGEAVFVPHPDGDTEDAGWLLTFVHDEQQNQSELLIVDARNLECEPVARVLLPQRVPYGFHAVWISDAQIQATL
ncbi:MAG: carotenoid oxygenase family protein [Leptolyngbyaceae cyanobacterium MO_188.B28]|nr:carotenoid oxygenase family protein [Leptolyngbyaceae cyanobacterium MO_188.B28]